MTVGSRRIHDLGWKGASEHAWNDDIISPFCWCAIEDMKSAASHRLRSTLHPSSIILVTKRDRRGGDDLDEQLETVSLQQGRDFSILKDRFALCGFKVVGRLIAPKLLSVLFLPRVTH